MLFTISKPLPLLFFTLSLLLYHTSEFLLVYKYHPSDLDTSSFLLSPPYILAMTLSLFEYHLTWHILPTLKQFICTYTLFPGLLLTFFGEVLRKAAWLTARQSFTHRIQASKRRGHELVTTGVYKFCRHPGYLGWFWWAVGTQVLLGNFVSAVAFALVARKFFKDRIAVEEYWLERMFRFDYVAYRQRTPTRIPGIK